MKLTVSSGRAVIAIRESLRHSLRAAGLVLPEPALTELVDLAARNATQALVTIDETPPEVPAARAELLRPCVWCGYAHHFTGDADDASKCPKCERDLSPVATRVFL